MPAGSSCRHEFVSTEGLRRRAGRVLAQYACEALRPAMRCTSRQLLRSQRTWLVSYAKRYRAGIRIGKSVTASGIWRANDVTVHGETASWKDLTVARHFCPSCGSALFGAFRR